MFFWQILTVKKFNFHWYVFPMHLAQCPNTEFLLMNTLRVLDRSSKCANNRYRKKQVSLQFTINSKSKLKNFSTLFLRHLPRKIRYEIEHGFMWVLWEKNARNFRNNFVVKSYYLNFNFYFKCCRVLSLKSKKRSQKICKLPKSCAT